MELEKNKLAKSLLLTDRWVLGTKIDAKEYAIAGHIENVDDLWSIFLTWLRDCGVHVWCDFVKKDAISDEAAGPLSNDLARRNLFELSIRIPISKKVADTETCYVTLISEMLAMLAGTVVVPDDPLVYDNIQGIRFRVSQDHTDEVIDIRFWVKTEISIKKLDAWIKALFETEERIKHLTKGFQTVISPFGVWVLGTGSYEKYSIQSCPLKQVANCLDSIIRSDVRATWHEISMRDFVTGKSLLELDNPGKGPLLEKMVSPFELSVWVLIPDAKSLDGYYDYVIPEILSGISDEHAMFAKTKCIRFRTMKMMQHIIDIRFWCETEVVAKKMETWVTEIFNSTENMRCLTKDFKTRITSRDEKSTQTEFKKKTTTRGNPKQGWRG